MAAASSNVSAPTEQNAVSLLCEFPKRRAEHGEFSTQELRPVLALLDAYVASSSKRTAPTKSQLKAAVTSLLPPNSTALSSKWNKCQLAYATRKWIIEAEELDPAYKQRDLFLEVRTSATDPKALDPNVFILEDDGSVAQFSVASPQPIGGSATRAIAGGPAQTRSSNEAESQQDTRPASDLFSPSSIATSASSFVRHLNELVDSAEPALAAIDTFPHPRVGNSSTGALEPEQPAGSGESSRCRQPLGAAPLDSCLTPPSICC